MTARFIVGDTRQVLATLPPGSVDLILSSPPFFQLRSYLDGDHADKQLEIGAEPTPGAYLDVLLDVVEACARVLAPHGTLAFELGDTYAGADNRGSNNGAHGGTIGDPGRHARKPENILRGPRGVRQGHESRPGGHHYGGAGYPLDKSLILIPQTFAFAVTYGRNPWTGRETPPWRVRNIVRWCRPNPPVGALGDKFRPATSEMVVACKARDRWFDLDAVRTEPSAPDGKIRSNGEKGHMEGDRELLGGRKGMATRIDANPAGAPPLDWWEIPTQPYKGAHYATWPERLLIRPIEAMCPRQVCTTCGQPRRRITEESPEYAARANAGTDVFGSDRDKGRGNQDLRATIPSGDPGRGSAELITIGWTDCGHDTWRRGVVLDPFAGSGTTGAVAEGHARDSLLIDLDARNAELAAQRIGMWLTVE